MKGNRYCHQICQQIYWLSGNLLADLLNLTKSADRNMGVSISAGRLTDSHKIYWPNTDCHQMCQQRCRGYFCHQIYLLSPNLLADLLTFTKSAGRNGGGYFCQQIYRLSPNLQSDLLTSTPNLLVEIGRYFCQQNYWLTKSGGRFTDFNIQSASSNWGGIYVPADLLTVTKSAGRFADIQPNFLA